MSGAATPAGRWLSLPWLTVAVLVLLGLGAPPAAADEPEVGAAGAVLWEPDGDATLWEREARRGRPPASTTKILTALLALEAGITEDTVVASATAEAAGNRPGAARLGLTAGQQISGEDLLAGLLLESGNDAAVAVAEHVAGSETAFVEQMNARAAALGLTDTEFRDASGLSDAAAHRASPIGLARLTEVAMADATFAELVATERYDIPGVGRVENRNELLGTYPGITGVKTGFTRLAGRCLVASATRDGRTLYAVVLGARDSFADATALLDHGFDDFARHIALDEGSAPARYRWAAATVQLVAADALAHTAPAEADPRWRVRLQPGVRPPVEAGAELGVAELLVDGEVVETTSLEAADDVTRRDSSLPSTRVGAAVADTLRDLARLHVPERQL